MSNKARTTTKLSKDDTHELSDSSSSNCHRVDGSNKNFKLVEDQLILKILDDTFRGDPPNTKKDYLKFSRLFNSDHIANKYNCDAPYFRDSESIRRRILNLAQRELDTEPIGRSKPPNREEKLLSDYADDPEFNEQMEKEKKRKMENHFVDDDDENDVDSTSKKVETSRKRINMLWDHPKTDLFINALQGSSNERFGEYFERKKALNELKNEKIINEIAYRERLRELAIKFSLIKEDDI